MSFLGMGTLEILIILLVAFIFLGPERMVDAARTLGKWAGEMRRMSAGVRAEMDDLISEDMAQQGRSNQQAGSSPQAARGNGTPTAASDSRAPVPTTDAPNTTAPLDTDAPVAFRSGGADMPAIPSDADAQTAHREDKA